MGWGSIVGKLLKTAGLKALKEIAEKIEDWLDSDSSKDTDKVVKAVVDDIVELEERVTKLEEKLLGNSEESTE